MQRIKTYGALLLLIGFCTFTVPRALFHHCEDGGTESSHAHAGDVQYESPECAWCDFEIPLGYEDAVPFDLPMQVFATAPDVALVKTPAGPDRRRLDPRGPPAA